MLQHQNQTVSFTAELFVDEQTTEEILRRAREEIAARQAADTERSWSGVWRWLLPVLVSAVLLAFLAVPAPLPLKLLLAMGGVCALRPAHSFFAGGVQLPIESRMIGIYGGFMLPLLVLLALRRLGPRRLGSRPVIGVLALFFSSMAFDGINSTLADLGLPHLYESTNLTRPLTGLLSAIAVAPLLLWLLGVMATPRGEAPAVIQSRWDLLVPLVVNIGFAALVVREQAALYYPIALVSVGGVVGVLTIVALLVIVGMSGLEGRITRVRQIVAPGALALLIAFAMLAVTATVRWSVTGMERYPEARAGVAVRHYAFDPCPVRASACTSSCANSAPWAT
jgi:uncharacterized membrane protein